MFKRVSGCENIEKYPNAISNAYSNNALVYPDGSGAVIPADATSGNHIGITKESINSSDPRYSVAGKIHVDVLDDNDIFEADVTGTLTTAMVGTYLDLSDSLTVNAGATSKQVVLCVGYISATKGLFKINSRATAKDVATT